MSKGKGKRGTTRRVCCVLHAVCGVLRVVYILVLQCCVVLHSYTGITLLLPQVQPYYNVNNYKDRGTLKTFTLSTLFTN
jgi:hypothetical protein